MKPLEAVARAIQHVAEQNGAPCYEHLRAVYPDSFESLHEQARAAITALRDAGVTEGMVNAWINVPVIDADIATAEMEAAADWRAMLAAVLEEE